MKIGLLTFHASHNYGSVLQAYALSHYLHLLGHQVEIINLRPIAQRQAYPVIKGRGVHRIYRYLLYPWLKKRYDEFERFINQVLPIGATEYSSTEELRNAKLDYDAFVCGGDQIWNPVCQDFETAYFLDFNASSGKLKISYSPSLGRTEFAPEHLELIRRQSQKFDRISVREERGAKLLFALLKRHVENVCDPVLLLSPEEWEKIAVKPKCARPYILTYFLENNHGLRNLTEKLQKMSGYEVIQLNEALRDCLKPWHRAYSASPEEFVGLFRNASFIYTNSFHGTAFATIFEKPFLCAIAPDQEKAVNNSDSRKIDYLTRLGLQERLWRGGMVTDDSVLCLDYSKARRLKEEFRDSSIAFLESALIEKPC